MKLTNEAFPCDGNRHLIPNPTKIPVVVAVVPLPSQTSHNPTKLQSHVQGGSTIVFVLERGLGSELLLDGIEFLRSK